MKLHAVVPMAYVTNMAETVDFYSRVLGYILQFGKPV